MPGTYEEERTALLADLRSIYSRLSRLGNPTDPTDDTEEPAQASTRPSVDVSAEQIVDQMAELMREAAGPPRAADEKVDQAIGRAARILKIDHGRAKKFWYREISRAPAFEVDTVRARIVELRRQKRDLLAGLPSKNAQQETLRDVIDLFPCLAILTPPEVERIEE